MSNVFSKKEDLILKVLGAKKMSIAEISKAIFDGKSLPFNANIVTATTIRRINEKCRYYKMPWTLVGKGAGRTGRTVWRQYNP